MENFKDAAYTHAKVALEDFKIKHLGDYHDLYVQSDKLLQVDVFKNFRIKCVQMYELRPVNFLLAPGLVCKVGLKEAEKELE